MHGVKLGHLKNWFSVVVFHYIMYTTGENQFFQMTTMSSGKNDSLQLYTLFFIVGGIIKFCGVFHLLLDSQI